MNKSDRHDAIRARAARAIANLYHNATPDYPRLNDADGERFNAWFEATAQFEIEYLRDGGTYGGDAASYRRTLAHECNAGRYKSEAARARYIAKGMREWTADTHSAAGAWQRISEFGKLYQWGRGGRTLAPDGLVKTHGGSRFSLRDDWADDQPIAAVVELIRIVESFNVYCESWCKGVPEAWAEQDAEDKAEKEYERNAHEARLDAFYYGV